MTTTESLDMIHVFYGIRQMYMQVWEAAEKMFSGGVPAPEVFDWCKHEYVENDAFLESWMEDFKQVYSAQPEPQWIPVTKKAHPDLPIRVQVQIDNGWIITAYYQEGEWLSVPDYGEPLQVEAWRELPEPYTERR